MHPAKKNSSFRRNERFSKSDNRGVSAVDSKKERHKIAIGILARDSDVIFGPETNKVGAGGSVRLKEVGGHVQAGHGGDFERAVGRGDNARVGSALYVGERRDNKIQRDIRTEGKLCVVH